MTVIPLTVACFMFASNSMNIPPKVLLSVLSVESGVIGHVSKSNSNGSVDIGPMQINNKAWLNTIARKHFKGNKNQAYVRLRDDGCYNVYMGAWILRKAINESGNIYDGIGRYHSKTPHIKKRYQNRIVKRYIKLFGE